MIPPAPPVDDAVLDAFRIPAHTGAQFVHVQREEEPGRWVRCDWYDEARRVIDARVPVQEGESLHELVLQQWGSGRYRLQMLTGTGRSRGYRPTVELMDPDYPKRPARFGGPTMPAPPAAAVNGRPAPLPQALGFADLIAIQREATEQARLEADARRAKQEKEDDERRRRADKEEDERREQRRADEQERRERDRREYEERQAAAKRIHEAEVQRAQRQHEADMQRRDQEHQRELEKIRAETTARKSEYLTRDDLKDLLDELRPDEEEPREPSLGQQIWQAVQPQMPMVGHLLAAGVQKLQGTKPPGQ